MVLLQTAVLALAVAGGGEGETVLLDFYADWCVPCRQMDPVVQRLAAMGHSVRRINIDQNRALAAKYGVDRLPCFVMLVDGQVADRVVGGTTFSRLERMCKLAHARQSAPRPPAQWAASAAAEPGGISIPPVPTGPFQPDAAPPHATGPSGFQPAGHASGPPEQHITPDGVPPGGVNGPQTAYFTAATVRLRIEDAEGHSCGSGTIIDARGGEALILTCGHIFRDLKPEGAIEVDLFGPTPAQKIPGLLRAYDLDRDIGLLTIRTPGPVIPARVAPPGYRVARGDRVINVGCNNGEPPTPRYSRVTSLDKYLGPPNLQVAGLPVQGRSGGGLFSKDGLLIGVCNAADPADHEGLYAALGSIHAQLDEAQLAYVYQSGNGNGATGGSLVGTAPPPMPRQMPQTSDLVRSAGPPTGTPAGSAELVPATRPQQLTRSEQAALEEIRRRRLEGAEVICVIRSRTDPNAQSEIIVLDGVSPAFLEQLAADVRPPGREPRQLTSLEVRGGRPTPLDEAVAAESRSSTPRTVLEYRADGPAGAQPVARSNWEPRWGEPGLRR